VYASLSVCPAQAGLIEEWKWRAMKRMKEEALAAGQAAHFEVSKLYLFD
jgi:hypothetical protein